jgi:hypothetical protein
MASYGPPILDFSPIGNLGNTFLKARRDADEQEQKQAIRQTLASLGEGNADYDTIGKKLLSLGELSGGLGFMKLGQEEKLRGAQSAADREAYRLLGGGSVGADPTYAPSAGTPRANIEGTVHVAETEDDVQRLERATGMNVEPDLDKVVRTVYGEAGNQGVIGQTAVANVIANRAQQSGMTPSDVVLAKGQFEPWSDPEARARMEALDPSSPEYQQLASIARNALTGQGADPTGGATHFYAPKAQAALGRNAPGWDNGTGRDIGDHRFFSLGYGPQGRVQVAQADVPAAGAREAQGFVVPGSEGAPRNQRIANLERALTSPNLSDNARRALQSRLDREYKLLDEAGKKTELQRNYEAAREQGFEGSIVDYQLAIRKAGATTVNNNVGGDAIEPEFNKETGKSVAKRLDAIAQEGDTARSDLAMVDQLRSVGGAINFNTMPALRGQLAEYGIKIGNDVGEIQAYNSIVDKLTPQQRVPGTGASSDLDVRMFKNSLPRLINTPEGNALIMDTMQAMGEDKIARAAIAERAQTGELTPAQAIKELRALPSPLAAFKERVKTLGQGTAEPRQSAPPAEKPAPQAPAPVQGARQAADGNWYVPDPNRPGKYLQVQQ